MIIATRGKFQIISVKFFVHEILISTISKCTPQGKVECKQDICLADNSMIESINSDDSLGWTATNYSEFEGRKYKESIEIRLGTFGPATRIPPKSRQTNKSKKLPNYFNSVLKWPHFVTKVRDQGWCASSWAISTAAVASDRYSIYSKGRKIVNFSPQQLLSCTGVQNDCKGGNINEALYQAWKYISETG